MIKKNKFQNLIWILVAIFLWSGSLFLMIWTNYQRSFDGLETYYSDALIITINTISTSIFSAMTFAIAVGLFVNKALVALKLK